VGKGLFSISYQDGSYASGDYFSDDIQIGNVTVKNQWMGVGLNTTIPVGIMGLGYDDQEAILGQPGHSTPYPTILDSLQSQGFISTKAYSLWLNDLRESKTTSSKVFKIATN